MKIRIQGRCDMGHDLLMSINEVIRHRFEGVSWCPKCAADMTLIGAITVSDGPYPRRLPIRPKQIDFYLPYNGVEQIHIRRRRRRMPRRPYKAPHDERHLSWTEFLKNLEIVLRGKCPDLRGKSPEADMARRKLHVLRKIMKLEHEFCGEEDW